MPNLNFSEPEEEWLLKNMQNLGAKLSSFQLSLQKTPKRAQKWPIFLQKIQTVSRKVQSG